MSREDDLVKENIELKEQVTALERRVTAYLAFGAGLAQRGWVMVDMLCAEVGWKKPELQEHVNKIVANKKHEFQEAKESIRTMVERMLS